jgi:general secretion pathway protein C
MNKTVIPFLLKPLSVLFPYIAGALLVFAVLLLSRDIVSVSFGTKETSVKSETKKQEMATHTLQEYSGILGHNPFGFPGGELKQLSAVSSESPRVTEVTLIGTVAGPGSYSYAVFMDKAGNQEVFKTGNQVFGAGVLRRIEKEKVFLSSGGKSVEVVLAELAAVKEFKENEPTQQAFARRTGEKTYAVDQKRVQNAIENPNQIMTDARLLPNVVDGRQEGFVLKELKPGGIYQNLGLQNGDILLRINEYNISKPEAALQAFTALRGMDRVQLDIIRSGAKMTMTYQLK